MTPTRPPSSTTSTSRPPKPPGQGGNDHPFTAQAQIQKEEETKRRISAAMKPGATMEIPGKPNPPSFERIVRNPVSATTPRSETAPPATSQVEKDEEIKKRLSAALKTVEAPVKADPPLQLVSTQPSSCPQTLDRSPCQSPIPGTPSASPLAVKFPRVLKHKGVTPSPKCSPSPTQPTQLQIELAPGMDKLIIPESPSSSTMSRDEVKVALPKARMGPAVPTLDVEDRHRDPRKRRFLLPPKALQSPKRSNNKENAHQQQHLSLPNSSEPSSATAAAAMTAKAVPPKCTPGERKQRVSLPPASPGRDALTTAATTEPQVAAITPSTNQRLAERKTRMPLPPSAAADSPARVSPTTEGRRTPVPSPPLAKCFTAPTNTPVRHKLGAKKQRVSLPPSATLSPASTFDSDGVPASPPVIKSLAAAASNTPVKHRLGQKKERVSLPPSAGASPTGRKTPPTADGASPVPPSPPFLKSYTGPVPTAITPIKHRLGDKKQRVSLPPAAAAASPSRTSQPASDDMQPAPNPPFQKSLTGPASITNTPLRKHGLGEKKQRVSLPPSSTAVNLPAQAVADGTARQQPAAHRHLGEKKNNRISLPSSNGQIQQRFSLASSSAEEEKKEEESIEVPTSGPGSVSTGRGPLPPKGLHRPPAGQQTNDLPVFAGPGAFFVPGGMVMDDVESEDSESQIHPTNSAEQQTNSRELGVDSGKFEEEPDIKLDIVEPDAEIDVEQEIQLDAEAPSNASRAEYEYISTAMASRPPESPKRKKKKKKERKDHIEEPRRCSWIVDAPWWCNIGVPLVLAAIVVALVVIITKAIKKSDQPEVQQPHQNVSAPVPLVRIFDNETDIPSFTLAAWENPSSPQSKARDWLQADAKAHNYTQARKVQRFALATFYYSTNGARWMNSTNWLSYDDHECVWYSAALGEPPRQPNITELTTKTVNSTMSKSTKAAVCNSDHEYEYLSLAADSLRGSIPPEISLLTSLVYINFEANKVHGSLPTELGSLTKLTMLELSQNELDGQIPSELGLATSLERFYLRGNKLTGSMPIELTNLISLKDLHVTDNTLTSTIPTLLGKLTQLQTLRLGGNRFIGTVPTELGLLSHMNLLNVGANQLSGPIPSQIGRLSLLTFFGVASNPMNTTIPLELTGLSNLQTLLATSTGIRGTIPSEIGAMTSLVALALGTNRLERTIPTEVGLLTNLEFLYLYSNRLTGPIPTEIGNLSRLSIIQAFVNQLSSTIPTEVGKLTNLVDIQLFQTFISGDIPSELGELSSLRELNIHDTSITGSFPNGTCSLVSSQQLTIEVDCEQVVCCAGM